MTDEVWRPLGLEGNAEFDALVDGVPAYLAPSFWEWVRTQYVRPPSGSARMTLLSRELVGQTERVLRFTIGYEGYDLNQGVASLRAVVQRRGIEMRLADFLLASRGRYARPDDVREMLEEAGSLWTVGTRAGKAGLVRRVEAGVQDAAEHVMTSAGRAGQRLAEAWSAAYGINPDPSRAYSLAVKAVEDAAIPVVEPKNQSATLGTVIRRMQQAALTFHMPREQGGVQSQAVLLAMMRLLWNGQGDRHGGLPDASVSVGQRDAEAAVLLAVPLVQLFVSDAVAPLV